MIDCKVELSLKWLDTCVLSVAENKAIFTIIDAKRYAPVVTLSTEVSVKLSKKLSEGFKRPVYWNKYKVIPNKQVAVEAKRTSQIRELLDAIYQGVKRLFVDYNDAGGANRVTVHSNQRYFLPRVQIKNWWKSFHDQSVNDLIEQYDEIRKTATDDYTTGCLLDFAYFKNSCRLIAADLSKQKALDADSRAIQQIISTGEVNTRTVIYYISEQSKETTLEPLKGIIIVLQLHTNGWIW